jgi:putative membrane protein
LPKRYPPWGQLGPRAIAAWGMRTQIAHLDLEGLEHIPASGPVMILARHVHHLLDGSIVTLHVPRPVHIIVGLDWAADTRTRRMMEWACHAADYPIVLRAPTVGSTPAYAREELVRYTRGALRDVVRLLCAGRVVLVFPEGYPNVDPSGSRKTSLDDWLPFAAGFVRMIELAERNGSAPVTLVPLGLRYERAGERWNVRARFGVPIAHTVAAAEAAVRALS